MVAYLSKSDASEGFDQIMDFLNAHTIQYALLVNQTIYVSCIKQFWATATVKKVKDVVQLCALIKGKKVVVSKDINRIYVHLDDVDGVECLSNEEIFEELARMGYEKPPHKLKFYKAMVRNVDSLSKFLMYLRFLQVVLDNQVDDTSTHNTRYTTFTLTQKVFANMRRVGNGFSGVETHLFALMLKKRVKKLEKKKRSKSLGFKRLSRVGLAQRVKSFTDIVLGAQEDASTQGEIEAIDADEDITLVDAKKDEEVVTKDAEPQGRINQEDGNAASKGVSATEPTVFDDEEVIMTMAQTLIKLKTKKSKLLDEQIAQKLHDEEVQKAAVRDKHKKDDMERAQRDDYDKVMPIFKREYKKVQTFKPDKDVEEPKKKRVADETLLQESFNKLKLIEVSESTQEIPSNDPKELSEEDVQNILVKEKFSLAVPSVDKEKALWVELKILFEPDVDDVLWKLQRYMQDPLTWKLYTYCGVHHVSSTIWYDIFMLTEKDYPLSNDVMILMLSGKLQVEDNEMARDLVMKIFIEANKPNSKSLDTSSK
nr:hypothetical protein [Tanacetum cinerariifolium]